MGRAEQIAVFSPAQNPEKTPVYNLTHIEYFTLSLMYRLQSTEMIPVYNWTHSADYSVSLRHL